MLLSRLVEPLPVYVMNAQQRTDRQPMTLDQANRLEPQPQVRLHRVLLKMTHHQKPTTQEKPTTQGRIKILWCPKHLTVYMPPR